MKGGGRYASLQGTLVTPVGQEVSELTVVVCVGAAPGSAGSRSGRGVSGAARRDLPTPPDEPPEQRPAERRPALVQSQQPQLEAALQPLHAAVPLDTRPAQPEQQRWRHVRLERHLAHPVGGGDVVRLDGKPSSLGIKTWDKKHKHLLLLSLFKANWFILVYRDVFFILLTC